MPSQVLWENGTPFLLGDHAGSYSPDTNNVLVPASPSPTTVQMGPGTLANDSYWQSDKFDFGASRALSYLVVACIPFAATPTAGQTVRFRFAPSMQPSSTADAVGNPGGVSGSDGAYTGYNANPEEAFKQLDWIGEFPASDDIATTYDQIAVIGVYEAIARYGTLVIHNNTGAAFNDDIQFAVAFVPIIAEGQ